MHQLSSRKRSRALRTIAVCWAAPLALCGLLLTGCSGDDESVGQSDQTSQEGGSTSGDSGDASPEDKGDREVGTGDVKVGTKIPDEFPDDMPLPKKAPTSVVTVGPGGGAIGGGWALNYDGVSMEEVEQVLTDAEAAGYNLNGPFESGSSTQWGLKNGTTGVIVLFSEDANLNITVTKIA